MELNLVTTFSEIANKLLIEDEPYDIFKIINLTKPGNWSFTFRFDSNDKVILDIVSEENYDLLNLMKGANVSVFKSESWEVNISGEKWHADIGDLIRESLDSNVLHLEKKHNTSSNFSWRLNGFCGKKLPNEFSSEQKLEKYLLGHTWLGSHSLPQNKYTIKISVLNSAFTYKNKSWITNTEERLENPQIPSIKYSATLGNPPLGTFHFYSYHECNKIIFRWSALGEFSREDMEKRFNMKFPKKLTSGLFEIVFQNHKIAPDGLLVLDENFQLIADHLLDAIEKLASENEIKSYFEKCAKYKVEQAASLIDDRKERLAHKPFVSLKGETIYKVPENEMETVALHQKLEGKNALPFANFCSLEYTSKLGIDSISHYKIFPSESMVKFGTIEYEFKLSNFFHHEHPVEQVDMIICWETDGCKIGTLKMDTSAKWLRRLHLGDKIILVCEIKNYPNIIIKNLA